MTRLQNVYRAFKAASENALVGVAESISKIPTGYHLEQNYPNPFNPTTVISFQVAAVSNVRLVVYDLLGREVATLVKERKEPGIYAVKFDAGRLASGPYYYRLYSGGHVSTRSMMLVK